MKEVGEEVFKALSRSEKRGLKSHHGDPPQPSGEGDGNVGDVPEALTVSIIITNYNYERFIADALQSVLDQSYPHTEIIVIDDGSTDQSPEIIRSFEKDGVKIITQKNQGQAAGFNTGFAASRGDLIFFLDADDALKENALETLLSHWYPGCSKAQFRLASIDGDGCYSGSVFPTYQRELTQENLLKGVEMTGSYETPPTSGNLFAREFLEEILPLDTSVHSGGGDGPLLATAPLFGDILTVDQILGYYRVHDQNDSSVASLDPAQFRHRANLDEKRIQFLEEIAQKKGFELQENLLNRSVLYQTYLLCLAKLEPGNWFRGLKQGCRTLVGWWNSPAPIGKRLTLLMWIIGMAISPKPLAKKLIGYRFLPSTRPQLFRRVIRRLGVGVRVKNDAASAKLSLRQSGRSSSA